MPETDPYGDAPALTAEDVLAAYGLGNSPVVEYVRGQSGSDAPRAEEWLHCVEGTDGHICLRIVSDVGADSAKRRFLFLSRDERGWVAAKRRHDESFATAMHYRPRPSTLASAVDDAKRVDAVLKEDLPLPLHPLFARATVVDDELHDRKPDSCHGCDLSRYAGAGPNDGETDFRLRRDGDEGEVWECGTCGTRTYLPDDE